MPAPPPYQTLRLHTHTHTHFWAFGLLGFEMQSHTCKTSCIFYSVINYQHPRNSNEFPVNITQHPRNSNEDEEKHSVRSKLWLLALISFGSLMVAKPQNNSQESSTPTRLPMRAFDVPSRPAFTRELKTAAEVEEVVRALMNAAYEGGLHEMISDIQSDDGFKANVAVDAHVFLCTKLGMAYMNKALSAGVCDALQVSCHKARDRRLRREQAQRDSV